MEKHFYIFRHGVTDYNTAGRVQGQGCDVPLNDKGREQALALAVQLERVALDLVYTSPLKRACETGKAVADSKKIPLVQAAELQECHFGIAEGKLREEINPADYAKHKGVSPDFKFEGGETQRCAANRAFEFLTRLAEDTEYNNIGISTHGGIIRFLLSYFFNIPTDMGIKHATPYHFIFKDGKFAIVR